MITRNGESITNKLPIGEFRTKYASAMAEYLAYDCEPDQDSGDVECPTGWFARFGKRILFTDNYGFVWVDRYPSEDGAEQVFYALCAYYDAWSEEDCEYDPTPTEDEVAAILTELDAFLLYVHNCATENITAYSFRMWIVNGKPIGPVS